MPSAAHYRDSSVDGNEPRKKESRMRKRKNGGGDDDEDEGDDDNDDDESRCTRTERTASKLQETNGT